MYLHPDLHLHSNVSDGTDSPAELLNKVRQSDIDIFALTDHDAYLGCQEISGLLVPGDPLFLSGIELSCADEGGKYHILGYGFDTYGQFIQEAVEITHDARREKALNRLHFLEAQLGISFSGQEVQTLMENKNPGKPHIVRLLLDKGCIREKAEGFSILSRYHGKERRLTPEEAIVAILRSGGIPVLAHGILADGSKKLAREQVTQRVQRLKAFGLMGLECFYSTYDEEQTRIMLELADQYQLLVTAGSDYHGSNKPVRLGDSGRPDPERMQPFCQLARERMRRSAQSRGMGN